MNRKLVLAIEDERPIATLLAHLAQSCGARTELAYNGQQGLDKMRSTRPDLVLLDLIMPVMNGEQVLATMEADPILQDIPVIVISTKAAVGFGPERVVKFLRKPFEPTEVMRLIRQTLALGHVPVEVNTPPELA